MIFAHRVSPAFPLVVAANRDEFHARPTAASAFWDEYPDVLAGRDLQQGGTWMGITRTGRFAAVTNYRDPDGVLDAPRSRGELPLEFLAGVSAPRAYLEDLAARARDYAGFNLLLGDGHNLWYFSNSDQRPPRSLPAGIYGLSNAALDTPWPKVVLGKARLGALLETGAVSHEALAAVVADRALADPDSLARLGLNGAMDPLLSAQFIVTDTYGTRSSTTLWIDRDGGVHWRERGFDAAGLTLHDSREDFTLQGA